MPKTPEVFAKEYAALWHAFDGAAPQLKDAEQTRARHDQALREAAQGLAQRVSALRAAGRAGQGMEAFKTDAEVQRWLGSLDKRLALAEADRQRIQRRAAGAWAQALKGAAMLDKELAADIAARQKLTAAKTGPGQKALTELLRLQTDTRKKLAPRRLALQTGRPALMFVDDPLYFQSQREQALAAAFGPIAKPAGAAAKPGGATPAKTTGSTTPAKTAGGTDPAKPAGRPAGSTSAPQAARGSTTGGRSSAPISGAALAGVPLPASDPLTVAAFKAAGRQVRKLVFSIRQNVVTARKAARAKKRRQVLWARTNAQRRLSSLEAVVKEYERARQETGDEAILKLRNGSQLLRGIKALVAVRERARAMVTSLSKLR